MSLRKKYFCCARKRIRVFTRVGFYDRLTGSITYFNKNTYDLLQPVPISSTTGHKYVYQNAGEMQNNGIELQFDYTILNYKDYSLSLVSTSQHCATGSQNCNMRKRLEASLPLKKNGHVLMKGIHSMSGICTHRQE